MVESHPSSQGWLKHEKAESLIELAMQNHAVLLKEKGKRLGRMLSS
jgi:hypothetical protein